MINEEEKPRQLPERFRVSLDPSDEAGYARLLDADKAQRELAERVNSPFTGNTPLDAARSKANILIQEYENGGFVYHEFAIARYAEALATVGRYDDAAAISQDPEQELLFTKYWDAVWLPDDQFCPHTQHHYVRELVWSVKENREMPLMACNLAACGMWNVIDAPEHVAKRLATEAAIQTATKGMSQDEVKTYLQENYRAR